MGQIILRTLHVNIKTLENTTLEITFKLCCFDLLCSRHAITVKIPSKKKSVLRKILLLFLDVTGQTKLRELRTQKSSSDWWQAQVGFFFWPG